MKYMTKFIFLASMLVLLVGCSGNNAGSTSSNWKTGNEGVVMEFSDYGIDEFFAGEEYSMVLELRNRGTFPEDNDDSLDVELIFSGFDRNLIGLPYSDSVSIQGGKTQTNQEGGLEYYELEFDVNLYEDADSLPQDIKVTACYEYETRAPIDVCVDPNPIKNDEDSCNPGVLEVGSGQGAPIAVTSVTQESLKGKTRYTIKIQNVGTGIVFRDNNCLNPELSDKDVVYVNSVYLGDEEMDCSPEERVRLVNGIGTLTCTLDGLDENQPAYTTSLGVYLEYNYKDSIVKPVLIKRLE